MEQNTAKRVPYGIQDFVQVIEQNCYYVDKTMYIPKLEDEPNNLFFIRPRRFGKSVFLSMLHAYYDCRTKDKFQQWFGNLWIGKHPTPLTRLTSEPCLPIWHTRASGKSAWNTWLSHTPTYRQYEIPSSRSAICRDSSWHIHAVQGMGTG